MEWIWLIIVGAIVGALGRLINPGSDPMGWIVTILLGIGSLLLAGLLIEEGFWRFVVGIIIAVVLVTIYGRVMAGRGRTATAP